MHTHTNHLIHETSPYLLQHAHNPVEWFPWGTEALEKAKTENKPILVSIGYAACHWCHVMERESFEDEATARIMNEHFVNIKIDREERPDLDHIYMDAVQAMTGSGGWPLNVFLTPEGRPFYGGTYFPPKRAYNRPSWQEILVGIDRAFRESRDDVDKQAETLTTHLLQSNTFGVKKGESTSFISTELVDQAVENSMNVADKEWGGFGKAPKFPQTFTIQFLLRYDRIVGLGLFNPGTGHTGFAESGSIQALLSLDKMIEGGIYDQIGGGFARYSTDTEWLAPHFEKMLYDNALLISVLSEAYQRTKKPRYREVIDETMGFICREMLHTAGGFYSALDADSEGEEGKFYVWDKDEVRHLLGTDADLFCDYFDITNGGNWEGKNILRVKLNAAEFAERNGVSLQQLNRILDSGKKKLLEERGKRIRPLLDDKIILGWNALMNTACSKAFIATRKVEYKEMAVRNMKFMLEKLGSHIPGEFNHTWKNDQAKHPAFLDDYAFLIQALIQLQEITGDTAWLTRASELAAFVIDRFGDDEGVFFYFTKKDQEDVIVRKKEVYDGAVPSGNSVMAYNLYHLSIYFDRKEWRERSSEMVSSLGRVIGQYPTSFGVWSSLLLEMVAGTLEIAIVGRNYSKLVNELFEEYIPNKILMTSESGMEEFPLIAGKKSTDIPVIYLCKDFVCQQPVTSIERFISLIDRA